MNVRVTDQTQTNNAVTYMRQRAADLAIYQDQVSSGLRVKLPSDDPGSFPLLSQVRSASLRLDAYSQTATDTTNVLDASVSALQDINDLLVRARQIAQEGADSSTGGDSIARESLATEVDGLIDRALRGVNTRPDGNTIFGGTAINTLPFRVATTDANGRPATIAYDGAAERSRILIGPDQTVTSRYVGSDVFQRPGADVFGSLIALRDDLRNTTFTETTRSQALNQRLAEVDSARTAVGETVGEQAATLVTLESIQTLTGDAKLLADTRVGELSATDYAEAVVKMQEQQTALQAIYATTAKLFETGLLDFIG